MDAKFKWDGYFVKTIEFILDILFIVFSIIVIYFLNIIVSNDYILLPISVLIENLGQYMSSLNFIITNITYILMVSFFFIIYKSTVINRKYSKTIFSILLALMISNIMYYFIVTILIKENIGIYFIIALFLGQSLHFSIYKRLTYLFFKKRTIINILLFGPYHDLEKYLNKFLSFLSSNQVLKYIVFENGDIDEKIFYYVDEVDRVYILPNVLEENKNKLITYCLAQKGINLCLVPKLYEVGITNSVIENIDDILIYNLNSLHLSLEERFFKRAFDIIFSIVFLIISLPIMLILTIVIKISDRGSVFYKQERVTINRKIFKQYKFRTMVMNAEANTGAVLSIKDDPRITKLGKILRALRLDELPQLFNILKGDMSFVGPRPERPELESNFVLKYPEFQYRLNVKAGLTGFAQIYGKYDTSPADKIRYDLYYIKKYSFWLDIKLILLTIKTIFDRESTRGLSKNIALEENIKNLSPNIKVINL